MKSGTFKAVNIEDLPEGVRVFVIRFIDEIINAGDILRQESQLVALHYNDSDSGHNTTKDLTIQVFSQRVLLSLSSSPACTQLFSRDLIQSYIQASKPLCRPVYIRAPVEMCYEKDTVLLVLKPLYGIP